MISDNWEIHASPFFSKAYCPKHHNSMIELKNGFFGNPVWWCKQCNYPYQLEFVKMRKWNNEAAQEQLRRKEEKA